MVLQKKYLFFQKLFIIISGKVVKQLFLCIKVFYLRKMALFSNLFSTEVQNLLSEKYSKIKTQSTGFKHKGGGEGVIKTYNFTLVDENEKFNLDRFIEKLSPILILLK